jgi:hypothetical protein
MESTHGSIVVKAAEAPSHGIGPSKGCRNEDSRGGNSYLGNHVSLRPAPAKHVSLPEHILSALHKNGNFWQSNTQR